MLSDLITPEIKLTIESVSMPAETNAPSVALEEAEEKDE
jgi:glycerol-3-phosphate O-acyltransferase